VAARLKEGEEVFCSFLVFKARQLWHDLEAGAREAAAVAVEEALAAAGVRLRGCYSLVGFRQDADLLLWTAAEDPAALQALAAHLGATSFARAFETTGAYLALAKTSPYTGAHVPAFLRDVPPQRYLLMYPFVKTAEWYRLPFEDRRRMMEEHGRMGAQWPQIFTNTLYAFGLGDFEFVLAFETERPADFLALLERLREAEVRRYTLRDTPIYLAARKPLWGVFEDLGVRADRIALLLEERPETVAALASGRQVVVLRRGGPRENAFGVPGDRLLLAPPGAKTAELQGRVEAAYDLPAEQSPTVLAEIHPLADVDARERFGWRGPAQPLRALALRVSAMPRLQLPSSDERFGDWVELRSGVRAGSGRPVLTGEEFAAAEARLRSALAVQTVEA
jgi:chlorite dismutase